MTNSEYPNLVLRDQEPVKRNVTGLAIRHDQLPNLAVDTAPDEGVRRKIFNGRLDGRYRSDRSGNILIPQKPEDTLEIRQCPSGINYRCHGLGLAATSPLARRPIQA